MSLSDVGRRGRWMYLVLGGILATLCVGCGESPQRAYETILRHGQNGEYDKIWDRIDKKSQGKLEQALEVFAKLGAVGAALKGDKQKAEELSNLKGKDLFVKLCSTNSQILEHFAAQEIRSVKVEGDRATLEVVATGKGKTEQRQITMVREDGIWKLSIDWTP